MNIKNCRICGRIYNYIAGPNVCPACRDSMEAKFQEVKDYIREHKGASIQEVSEACEVDAQQIRQWLRDDRLEVTEDSAIYLSCENCGALIRSGRFCEKCKNDVTRGFNDMARADRAAEEAKRREAMRQPDHENKMRFL